MKILLLNDVHVGFNRKGGTTPKSREALRDYLLSNFRKLVEDTDADHLVIVGDLFDDFEIDGRDWVEAYLILAYWLREGRKLTIIAGNHDWSPRGHKVSSFEMLCTALRQSQSYFHSLDINTIDQIEGDRIWAIAHCANQDVFNARLDEALECVPEGGVLLLHANYNNNFAVEADHSLNVSREVALKFKAKGVKLVFAHEHQTKSDLSGMVYVMGNQWPTSVSDCLGNVKKYAHVIDTDDVQELERIETWDENGPMGLQHLDWTELDQAERAFIRITGEAKAEQASDVINVIALFRQKSDALVTTNAVQFGGITSVQDLPKNFEATKAFDVMEFISQHFDADEMKTIKELSQ